MITYPFIFTFPDYLLHYAQYFIGADSNSRSNGVDVRLSTGKPSSTSYVKFVDLGKSRIINIDTAVTSMNFHLLVGREGDFRGL